MTRLESWRGVPVGTRVVVRRADGSSFDTRTSSRAFEMLGGAAVIRVDGNAVQDYYPLDRVSLGYDDPRPVAITHVPLASTLDPPPAMRSLLSMLGDALVLCAFAYVLTLGLATIAAAVLR